MSMKQVVIYSDRGSSRTMDGQKNRQMFKDDVTEKTSVCDCSYPK